MNVIGSVFTAVGLLWFLLTLLAFLGTAINFGAREHLLASGFLTVIGLLMVLVTLAQRVLRRLEAPPAGA